MNDDIERALLPRDEHRQQTFHEGKPTGATPNFRVFAVT
jgi:hypothetical protein